MKMSNRLYDTLKWIAQVFLPALITLWGVIGTACDIPYTDVITTVAIGVDTFLGSILGISSHYYKGKNADEQ
jgi:hypothetical protein